MADFTEEDILQDLGVKQTNFLALLRQIFRECRRNWHLTMFVLGLGLCGAAVSITLWHRFQKRMVQGPDELYVAITRRFSMGLYQGVVEMLEVFIKEYPEHPRAADASFLIAESKYQQALLDHVQQKSVFNAINRLFQENIGKDLSERFAFLNRLRIQQCYQRMGMHAKAELYLRDLLERAPPEYRGEVMVPLAESYLANGKPQEALALIADLEPGAFSVASAERLLLRGKAMYQLGRKKAAGRYLSQLVGEVGKAIENLQERLAERQRERVAKRAEIMKWTIVNNRLRKFVNTRHVDRDRDEVKRALWAKIGMRPDHGRGFAEGDGVPEGERVASLLDAFHLILSKMDRLKIREGPAILLAIQTDSELNDEDLAESHREKAVILDKLRALLDEMDHAELTGRKGLLERLDADKRLADSRAKAYGRWEMESLAGDSVLRGDVNTFQMIEKSAYLHLAYVHLARDEFEQALEKLARARGEYPFHMYNVESVFMEGETYFAMGQYDRAIDAFYKIDYEYPHAPEARAARVRISDCYLAKGEMEKALGVTDATDAGALRQEDVGYMQSLPGVRGELTGNRWLDPDVLAENLRRLSRHFFDQGDLDRAILAVDTALQNIPNMHADYALKARLYEAKAERILAQGGGEDVLDAGGAQRRAWRAARNYLQAGHAYMDVVTGETSGAEFSDAAWNASRAYALADFVPGALQAINRFIANSVGDQRMSWAKYKRGRYYQKLGLYEDAVRSFHSNAEQFSRNFYGHLSRYEEGMSYFHRAMTQGGRQGRAFMDDLNKAEKIFLGIISDRNIFPNSQIWKDSFFNLGEIYYRQSRYAESQRYLSKAWMRYPRDPRAVYCRFLLGKTYENIGELPDACKHYDGCIKALELAAEMDEDLLVESYVSLANCYFAQKMYPDAKRYYDIASKRFLGTQEAVWALFQIGNCYQGMGDTGNADVAYARAKWTLNRTAKKRREAGGDYTPPYWEDMLDWLEHYAG